MSVTKEYIGTWAEVRATIPVLTSPRPAEEGVPTVATVSNISVPAREPVVPWLAHLPADEVEGAIEDFLHEWNTQLDSTTSPLTSLAEVMDVPSSGTNREDSDTSERSPRLTPYVLERPASRKKKTTRRRSRTSTNSRQGTIRINGETYLITDHWLNDSVKENIKFD